MRDLWIPQIDKPHRDDRPFVEAPAPFEYLPRGPMEEERREEEDSPRVIIIDI